MIFVVLVFGAVVVTIAYDYKQKTKWRDACLQEQRDEGYNHERAKRRCMMRWIEVEKQANDKQTRQPDFLCCPCVMVDPTIPCYFWCDL
jgi:hypothetical protein